MIGGTFEYLISSLPELSFQNTEKVRQRVLILLQKYAGEAAEDFDPVKLLDKEAQKFLPESIFNIFKKIDLKNIHDEVFQKSKIRVLSDFAKFDFELKKDMKAWRISQSENEKKTAKKSIEQIIGNGSHLEKEVQIMKYQWNKIQELSIGHFADMEALFTYKIKLVILLRWWSFDVESGFEKFTRLTTNE